MSVAWTVGLTVLGFWVAVVVAALVVWIAAVRLIRACAALWDGAP